MKVGGSRVKVCERNFFYPIVCIESIKYVCTLCKRYFQLYQWRFSLLRPQNTRIFKFLLKSVGKRSKIIVCEKKLSIIVCNKNFRQMYAYRKKNLTEQPKVFFRFASKYLDFCVVATPSLQEIKGHSITATYCTTYFLQWKF